MWLKPKDGQVHHRGTRHRELTVSPMWVQEEVEKSSQSPRPNRGSVPDRRLKSTASTGVIVFFSNP